MDRLDKVSNIKKLNSGYTSYRDKEVDRFELQYSGCKLIRDHYQNEDKLDEDWYAYSQMPYELQLVADNESIRIYGVSCRIMYRRLKKRYRRQDIDNTNLIQPVYYPKTESGEIIEEPEHEILYRTKDKDEYARKVAFDNDIVIIKDNYENLKELMNDWYRFSSLDKDKRLISDDESIKIYGFDNYSRYLKQYNEFIKDDIDDSDIMPKVYVSDVLLNLMDECAYETDKTRKIQLIDTFNEELDNIENKHYRDYILDKLAESLKVDVKLYNSSNSVPMYIPDIDLVKENTDIAPFQINNALRFYGFTPLEEDYYYKWKNKIRQCMRENRDEDVRLLGWNPDVSLTRENFDTAKEYMNSLIENEIGYNFINLTENYLYGNTKMDMNNIKENNGIYILFFDDYIGSFIYISTGNLDTLYPITLDEYKLSGYLTKPSINFHEVVNKLHNPTITVYYIGMDTKLCTKVVNALKKLTDNYTNININFLKNLFYTAGFQYNLGGNNQLIKIANQRVVCIYVLNTLIQLANNKIDTLNDLIILPTLNNLTNYSNKDNIYILYQDKANRFDPNIIYAIKEQYSKKYEIKSKSMKKNKLYEAYCSIIPLKESANVLNPLFVNYRNRSKYLIAKKNSLDISKELDFIYKDISDINYVGEEKLKHYLLELIFLSHVNTIRRLQYKSSIVDLYNKIRNYLNISSDIVYEIYNKSEFRIFGIMNNGVFSSGSYTINQMSDFLNNKVK